MEFVAFLSILLVALVTYLRNGKVGLVAFAVFLAVVIAVTLVWGDRETLGSAMFGALLGLPALIGVLVFRQRRGAKTAESAQSPPQTVRGQ